MAVFRPLKFLKLISRKFWNFYEVLNFPCYSDFTWNQCLQCNFSWQGSNPLFSGIQTSQQCSRKTWYFVQYKEQMEPGWNHSVCHQFDHTQIKRQSTPDQICKSLSWWRKAYVYFQAYEMKIFEKCFFLPYTDLILEMSAFFWWLTF